MLAYCREWVDDTKWMRWSHKKVFHRISMGSGRCWLEFSECDKFFTPFSTLYVWLICFGQDLGIFSIFFGVKVFFPIKSKKTFKFQCKKIILCFNIKTVAFIFINKNTSIKYYFSTSSETLFIKFYCTYSSHI